MTTQGHVTTASLNKHIRKIIERYFLSIYISKSSAHLSLKVLAGKLRDPKKDDVKV